MALFDANCTLGRRAVHTPLDVPTTPEALLAAMDRLGIAEALVTDPLAIDGHPMRGNERLLRQVAGHPRLHPCWVLLPDVGEMPAPAQTIARMKEHGVRAARIYPNRHRYAFTPSNLGGLLAELEAARIPLFVDFEVGHWGDERTDWRGVDDVCARYPELPVVVVGESIGAPRRLFPFWERHRNLRLETSYYQVHQGLSEVARRFGAGRLLFGTGLPVRAPGPALALLRHDFLSEEERTLIGGGNLRALLAAAHGGEDRANRDPSPPAPPPPSRVRRGELDGRGGRGVRGRPDVVALPSHPIIDAHAHLGTWYGSYIHAADADGLMRSLDRLNIRAMGLVAMDAIGPDVRAGNDQVAAAMRAYPGRFLGYATVDPNEPGEMAAELERCFGQLGFHGIKFHCDCHGYPADSDRYRPALEYADAHRLPILIHGGITEAMLASYPGAQLLSAHAGGWNGRAPLAVAEWCRDYPNLYLDLASSVVWNGALEKLVEAVGAGRTVHGSDAPLMDPAYQLGRVLAASLSPEEKRKILHDNAARLFGLP